VNVLAPSPPTKSTTSMLTSTSDPTPVIVAAVTLVDLASQALRRRFLDEDVIG